MGGERGRGWPVRRVPRPCRPQSLRNRPGPRSQNQVKFTGGGQQCPPHTAVRFIMLKHMTEQIKRKLQEEMNTLEHELVHELPKEIKKAAALGDRSENAEDDMAKQRQ